VRMRKEIWHPLRALSHLLRCVYNLLRCGNIKTLNLLRFRKLDLLTFENFHIP
jgi:hypothetical protein